MSVLNSTLRTLSESIVSCWRKKMMYLHQNFLHYNSSAIELAFFLYIWWICPTRQSFKERNIFVNSFALIKCFHTVLLPQIYVLKSRTKASAIPPEVYQHAFSLRCEWILDECAISCNYRWCIGGKRQIFSHDIEHVALGRTATKRTLNWATPA